MFTVRLCSPFFIFLFFSFSTYISLIGNNFFPWKLNMKSPTSSLQPFAIEPGLRGIGSLSLLAFILVFFLSVLYCAVLLHHLSIISEKSFPFCMNIFKKLPLIRYDFLSKKFTKTATANGSLLHGASLYVHTAENIINFFFFFIILKILLYLVEMIWIFVVWFYIFPHTLCLQHILMWKFSTNVLQNNFHLFIQIGLLERCNPLDVAAFHWRLGIMEKWWLESKPLAFHS